MTDTTRRKFLTFLGVTAGAAALPGAMKGGFPLVEDAEAGTIARVRNFTPVRLPHPLPIYTEIDSFLPTDIFGGGETLPASADPSLNQYTIIDDVAVSPDFERYVIVRFGERCFPNADDYVGYNHDYTGFVPLRPNGRDGLLYINHEYVSFPFSDLAPDTPDDLAGFPTSFPSVVGFALPNEVNRELLGEMMYNQGGSVVRIQRSGRRGANARYRVVKADPLNRRIHGLSGLAINAGRSDGFEAVTGWGTRPHQQGDENYLIGTGPAATEVFEAVNTDGLGNRIIGTAYNCSGATTPWGTILSCEENFQGSSTFFIGVQEGVLPNGSQTGYAEGTSGAEFGLVGEKYGWTVEIDPRDPQGRSRKHTALGRFRHENVALRVRRNRRLVAYQGDDRRGGHVWKYVSDGLVGRRVDPANSALLEQGTLYVARFNADGTGEWIPLLLSTPLNPVRPSELASVELAETGSAQRNANINYPRRNGIAGATEDGGFQRLDLNTEAGLDDYLGGPTGTLADFYESQGALLCDAFAAANLIGGTPSARPEDIEVSPINNDVYIAFTDGAAGGDGYPDSRIFQVGKYAAGVSETQPQGAIFRLIEDSRDGSGTTFRWERFVQAGEAGAEDGAGFAAVDNMLFDRRGNLWCVCDMSTSSHNGFNVGANPTENTIDHTATGGAGSLVGVYGNNWLFVIPTRGRDAGAVVPIAYGPPRCEMTGPTIVGDTLFLSVQHPSEDSPINDLSDESTLNRDIELLRLDGTLFTQNRTLPRGSNWPSNIDGQPFGPPRPATIGIRRRSGGRLV